MFVQAPHKVYSLDALFGLPRKKSAGESIRSPLHGDLFFCDQAEVDDFVVNASSGLKDDSKVIRHIMTVVLLCACRCMPAHVCTYIVFLLCLFILVIVYFRTATTFWQVICYEVTLGSEHWMKQLFLGLHVAMNFHEFFLISSMRKGTYM